MGDIWLLSDTHLGHGNILKFKVEGGERLRKEFTSLVEMHEAIFDNWAATVKPGDRIFHLGDVALRSLGRKVMKDINKLPGQKYLVRGNHDKYDDKQYHDAGFRKIYGVHSVDGIWFTHIPIHPKSLDMHRGNVHGHLHGGNIRTSDGLRVDRRYFNVSVENINYTPISLDEIILKRDW